jgi:hypothetical protein
MAQEFAKALATKLSTQAQILTDVGEKNFDDSIKQWSDYDAKIPAAVLKAGNEEDVVEIVRRSSYR